MDLLRTPCRPCRLGIAAFLLLAAVIRPTAAPAQSEPTRLEGKAAVHLYFADRKTDVLRSEVRAIEMSGGRTGPIQRIIEALIAGPKSELMRTLPAETALRAVYWSEDGTAILDFTDTLVATHPGGCATELLTIFSIVNTLVLNLDEVRQVKILVGGRESPTLAGHVDIRYPLQAEMLMVQ
ncbi:MAG TPA: GerMN domain-containing protein [Desulfobacterales bacterium]